jgi:hypothetical protein
MTNDDWRRFFVIAHEILVPGDWRSSKSTSWCAYATFGSLEKGAFYYNAGIPSPFELGIISLKDGGTWREPLSYDELAHIVVPKSFFWETESSGNYASGIRTQDIDGLSRALLHAGIPHRITEIVLEIKLY